MNLESGIKNQKPKQGLGILATVRPCSICAGIRSRRRERNQVQRCQNLNLDCCFRFSEGIRNQIETMTRFSSDQIPQRPLHHGRRVGRR
jgi:hypothetical protein